MTEVAIEVVSLVNGEQTPFDGEYLVEYDPERDGVSPDGEPMTAHVVTTPNLDEARRFGSHAEAFETWRKVCERHPRRPDGRPNRPLTAFTVEIAPPEKLRGRAK